MASLNIPRVLANNTTADANHVMDNFVEVKNFVDSRLVQIDGSVKAPTVAIADNAITTAKILNNNVTNAKLDYTTVPQITVQNTGPSGGKDGDIWVQVV